jgi:GntR family transcriptional regulator
MDKLKGTNDREVLQEHNQLPIQDIGSGIDNNPNTIQSIQAASKQLYCLCRQRNFVAPPKSLKNSLKEKDELTYKGSR